MNTIDQDLSEIFARHSLSEKDKKDFLRRAVNDHWPSVPAYSSRDQLRIHEVEAASVGSGVVITWKKNGVRKVFLGQAGEHYAKIGRFKSDSPPCYTIPGGFILLTHTKGSSLVPASARPENGYTGGAREVEEECREVNGTKSGAPLLQIDPSRLKPMDTESVAFPNGNKMVVIGMRLEATDDEVEIIENHVARLENDPAYKEEIALLTNNEETGLPEIADKKIFDLDEVVKGNCLLLNQDQLALFKAVKEHFDDIETPKKRIGPTLAARDKIKRLDDLSELTAQWRQDGNKVIGVTAGVFDIQHPGHISFLEDANQLCDKLIVIVASDNSVKIQKGPERPLINEIHRAQSLSSNMHVDAVIISDELYHETILKKLKPQKMFKGHDYANVTIMGAEHVDEVVIIPCAEDKFISSTDLIQTIRGERRELVAAPSP